MATTIDSVNESKRARWPRDLKIFALLAALWAAGLTGRVVVRDLASYAQAPLEAILFGMRFDGYPARFAIIAQAMVAATTAIGLNHRRKWGLMLALIYMLEMVASNLIFMTTYLGDLTEGSSVRLSGLVGIVSVMVLLYLWIRARDVLFE
jgi:hypothetical protein